MMKEMSNSDETAAGVDIDNQEIARLIPHRYPFLLVDRAEDYIPYVSIVGIKNVTINEPFFVGHFPGRPFFPGVLLIEAMAQTGGVLMSKSMDIDVSKHGVFFMSVDNVRFRAPVQPGDVVKMPVEAKAARHGVFKFRGMAQVNGKKAAEAEFAARLVPIE